MMGWFAIMTEPRRELAAATYLRAEGIEAYCPMVREMRRRRVRGTHRFQIKPILAAAFPRYLFAQATIPLFQIVKNSPLKIGRMWIVSAGRGYSHRPIMASDEVIDEIRSMTEMLSPVEVGAKVRLNGDVPLLAQVAAINRLHTHGEVSLWLKMLGAERLVTVPLQAIGAIAERNGRWITATETV